MRFEERGEEEMTNQTVVGVLRMRFSLIGMRSRTAVHLLQLMPVSDLHDEEREHDQKQ